MISDLHIRSEALNPDASFICEAPAGSGKTELLTQRVLTLLARVSVPESVLAITFTRKAAAEMQERVLTALVAAQLEKPTDEHKLKTWLLAKEVLLVDQALGWELLQNPARLNIRTFDGLSRSLTQALPLQAAIDAQWQPSDDPDQLYREATQDFLDTLEQDVPWLDALKNLFVHLDNRYDVLERLLVSMLQSRDTWMPILGVQDKESLRPILERFLSVTVADKIEVLSQSILAEHEGTLLPLCEFAGGNAAALNSKSLIAGLSGISLSELPGYSPEGIFLWQAIAELLLTKDNKSWRKRLSKNEGFPVGEGKEEKAAFKEMKAKMAMLLAEFESDTQVLDLLREIRFWPSLEYTEQQWQVLDALTRVLPIAVVHLHWVFRRKKAVDFTEISQRARQALGEDDCPTDLALRLDHSITHILVDEFQDTSFTQVDLLKKLTYGWEPGDGRTLFCVGDAMQSIYGFRGANVGLFLHCKNVGLGPLELTPLQLTANFRSQAGVVQWVNNTFASAFPSMGDISSGAVPYSMAEPFRKERLGASVSAHIFNPDPGQTQALAPVKWLVQELRSTWQQNPEATVGVLVKSRNHAAAIVTALEDEGILYRAIDLVPLKNRPVVQDLLALTFALLFPGDRVAWLSVLRASWCGLTLKDLTCVTASCSHTTVLAQMGEAVQLFEQAAPSPGTTKELFADEGLALTPDGYDRLVRVNRVLAEAVRQRLRKSLVGWVEGVWRALGGHCFCYDAGDQDNIERYWQMLEAFDQKGQRPSREALERAMSRLYAAPNPKATAKLQIMTVHKSKGLEFDVVFLPELHRGAPSNDAELLLWNERLSSHGEETVLFAPISAAGQEKTPIYKHLDFEKKKRLKLETCRLLYVACTRARERLYLMASLKPAASEDGVRFAKPASGSLLSYIWPSVELTVINEDGPLTSDDSHISKAADDQLASVGVPLIRAAPGWQPPPKPAVNALADFIIHHQYNNQESLDFLNRSSAKEVPRLVGTVVHETAYVLARQEVVGSFSASLWCPKWRARLLMLGVPQGLVEEAVISVKRAVEQLVAHPKFTWLARQPTVLLEYPVSVRYQQGVTNYVLDVLVVTEQNHTWVIDYKTSEPAVGETKEAFLSREQGTYTAAMKAYERAVISLGYNNVKSALFFVCTGDWLELV